MNDLNKVILIGRLTRDPELKTIGETSVGKFSIAVGSSYKKGNEKVDETSFFDCEVWGKLADVLGQYATKGKQIAIEGKLKQDTWSSQDGKKASKVKIRVENFQLLGGKSGQAADPDYPTESGIVNSDEENESVF